MARTAASAAFQLHWTVLLMVEMMQLIKFMSYPLPPPKQEIIYPLPPPKQKNIKNLLQRFHSSITRPWG